MVLAPHVAERLRQLYGDVLYRWRGYTYPVAVYRAAPTAAPDDVIGALSPSAVTAPDFAIYDAAHLQDRIASRQMFNGLCYVAADLTCDPLRLSARTGYYFDMIATCDALDHEMRAYGRGERADLPLRDALHRHIPPEQALINGAGRCTVVGGAVLTVVNDGGVYKAIIARRSPHLATGAGLWHILPAFIVQPHDDIGAGWSWQAHILREFGEELFGLPEPEAWPSGAPHDHFRTFPPIRELTAMLDDGRATLRTTGVALNLLSLRFEICAALVIHDADWLPRHRAALTAAQDVERMATHTVALDALDDLPAGWEAHFAPQGMAALGLGADLFA
ncbi:MAG: hypothetical protein EA396_04880 [Anaerolineaceae bacterium]|nr:MAG: hypothetical protein EA396_04880 [Anaerolineaceae bacterium]